MQQQDVAVESAATFAIGGAVIKSIYAERQVKVYAVHESEVQTIGWFNSQASALIGLGSALLTYGIGILTNAAFAEKLTPIGEAASLLFAPILIGMSLLAFVGAALAIRRRSSVWSGIKKESQSVSSRT